MHEHQRLNRTHWMTAPSILETYTETTLYHRAFAELYGDLACTALAAGNMADAIAFTHKAVRHAWPVVFSQES